jgi:hypothetical protein
MRFALKRQMEDRLKRDRFQPEKSTESAFRTQYLFAAKAADGG